MVVVSFDSPASSVSPGALRRRIAPGLPFREPLPSVAGRSPLRSGLVLGLVLLVVVSFDSPASSVSPGALRRRIAPGLPFRERFVIRLGSPATDGAGLDLGLGLHVVSSSQPWFTSPVAWGGI